MFYLIGLGLWDEKDITVKGLEKARNADEVYLEEYTSVLKGTTKKELEKFIGRKIVLLEREELEQNTEWLKKAKNKTIALLVGGDPLVATTHTDLMMKAWEQGIKTKVIHNASILSAVSESGLQPYKFGKTTTITYWSRNYQPKSFYKVLEQNKKNGLHTLLLLDIKKNRKMTPKEAINTMAGINPEFLEEEVVVMSSVGGDTGIKYGKAGELKEKTYSNGLHVLIVPGDLHVMEKAYLRHFRKH